jgi:hypothetical protein
MSGIEDLFKQQSETATDEPDAPASEPEGDQEDWQPADADNRRPEWLEDETPVVLEAEAAEAPTETEAKGEKEDASPASELPQRDEKGRFTKDEPASHQVPLEAMLHERERRQKAERELEELRNAQAKETDEEAPDFFDDPKKAVTSTVKRELQAERETLLTEAERRARELFFQYTERAARKQFPDYDEARAVFAEEVQRNPMLQQRLAQADDPASFVYEEGKTLRERREVGGTLTEYRKRVEAEAFERFKAEQSAKRNRTANVPKSLNTEPSKGAGVEGGQWAGPTPLFDILPNKME